MKRVARHSRASPWTLIGKVVAVSIWGTVALHVSTAAAQNAPGRLELPEQQDRKTSPSGGAAERDGRIRIQLSALRQTTLSAELAAKISLLDIKEGDSFKQGQTLVAFDCSWFAEQLNKAEAASEAARLTASVNRRLGELNAISALEVEQSVAKAKEADADAAAMRVTVSKCDVTAPFAGRVAKVHAEPYQYVTQGKPLLDILDSRTLEVKLLVPSRWLTWITAGTRFDVRIDDLGRTYPARVTRLGALIDPVSQTVSLAGEIEGVRQELLPGMSGWASFRQKR